MAEERDYHDGRRPHTREEQTDLFLWRLRQLEDRIRVFEVKLDALKAEIKKDVEETMKEGRAETKAEVKGVRSLLIGTVVTFSGTMIAALLTLLSTRGLL